MSRRVNRRNVPVLFNLEVFRQGSDKEIKISAMPLKYLDEIVENIKEKYR